MYIKYKVKNVSVMHLKRHVFDTFYEAVLDFMKLQCFLGRKEHDLNVEFLYLWINSVDIET